MDANDSHVLFKGACAECGSSDANAVYSDGHTYCYSCETYGKAEGASSSPQSSSVSDRAVSGLLPIGEFRALGKRQITEETCKKLSYTVSTDAQGRIVQIANYKRDGKVIAQKLRYPDKAFKFLQDKEACKDKGPGLFGEHAFKEGGKILVITEGEIDALTVSQLQGNKWPVVSLPNGADKTGKGAKRDVGRSIDFVNSFDKVVFMFDMDEPGQASAKACATLLPPGKAFIASLPLKDPNEMLVAGRGREVVSAMWDAKPYRPDGIVNAADLWDRVRKPKENNSVAYPWDALNRKTLGARKGELVVLTAGSGVGKSAVVREIAYHLMNNGQTVGMLMLEENIERTALGFMGLHLNHPLHLDRGDFTEEELHAAFTATSGSGKLYLYDHFGSTSAGNLLERVRYLASGCGCDFIVLDHISIAVSDAEANDTDLDERRLIDMLMTKLRSLVEELGVGMFVISHLRRPQGKGHEEGAMTSLSQLRGSHAIAQLADFVIGLERNQQDEETRNETTLRVLKNRFSGDTGEA
ncbi:DnaB-like helicase C-terminal domain-containing protein, partial [Marinobacterium sp. xm-d-509]|uniref:DnaB-like helicase C-terminal domain-containing protein n=1 Tax=Marinobacterium sp. xm-d-509 TaxID=2497739 RepID=UPI00156A0853